MPHIKLHSYPNGLGVATPCHTTSRPAGYNTNLRLDVYPVVASCAQKGACVTARWFCKLHRRRRRACGGRFTASIVAAVVYTCPGRDLYTIFYRDHAWWRRERGRERVMGERDRWLMIRYPAVVRSPYCKVYNSACACLVGLRMFQEERGVVLKWLLLTIEMNLIGCV